MQTTVDTDTNLLAVVLAKDAKNRARDGFKRRPLLHVLDLATGNELWKYDVGEVEMMPARWHEDSGKEVDYTLDNYYPPAFIGGRLYVFYEGVTSFDARSGKERLREKYRVNEDGLALTEAEPIFTEGKIYVSGHGRVRAISRQTGDTEWEAKDLGLTPEMVLVGDVLYVRTGGQFTRLKDGETIERGSYGVSAIDVRDGKVLWRYKGADKGITNLVMPDRNTIVVADRDDLIFIDAGNGKRRARVSHKIERASFGTLNESGSIVIGGQSEIVAFDPVNGRQLWRARHTAARARHLSHRCGHRGACCFTLFSFWWSSYDGASWCADRASGDEFELVWIGIAVIVFKLAGARDSVKSTTALVGVQAVWDRIAGARSNRSFTTTGSIVAIPLAS